MKQHGTRRCGEERQISEDTGTGSSCAFSELITFPFELSQSELLLCPLLLTGVLANTFALDLQLHDFKLLLAAYPPAINPPFFLGCQNPPSPTELEVLDTCSPAPLTARDHDPG